MFQAVPGCSRFKAQPGTAFGPYLSTGYVKLFQVFQVLWIRVRTGKGGVCHIGGKVAGTWNMEHFDVNP
jgi:hypothetical protein